MPIRDGRDSRSASAHWCGKRTPACNHSHHPFEHLHVSHTQPARNSLDVEQDHNQRCALACRSHVRHECNQSSRFNHRRRHSDCLQRTAAAPASRTLQLRSALPVFQYQRPQRRADIPDLVSRDHVSDPVGVISVQRVAAMTTSAAFDPSSLILAKPRDGLTRAGSGSVSSLPSTTLAVRRHYPTARNDIRGGSASSAHQDAR